MTEQLTPTIRRAGPDDAAILRLMIGELADHQDEGRYVTVTVDQWRKLLGRDDVVVFLAEHRGEAAGYVSALRRLHLWTGGDILGLDDLYVREQFRDTGTGRALMLELARYALPQQLTIAWGMRPENEGAQRFYTRLGATLRPKIVASWDANTYAQALTPIQQE
ncbi:GNAT family N-acetyltransferase [Kribbella catacumbae]|uniref:GNAT family N-acetyltransferase n=1 Tax=Kribbella catacumbae TaxID=460086 RepID=UPI000361CEC6|nr:GNAT family N-acetyltransferase [Kribbella catacumbae]